MAVEMENQPAVSDAGVADTQVVESDVVACDGTGLGSGHPRVFLNFGHGNEVVCPYCSRRFVLAEGAKRGHH